jgi:hypothetical protein
VTPVHWDCRYILDIHTTARRIIERDLDRRVSNNEISLEKVTPHSWREKDAVRISENRILFDYVSRIYRSRKTHTEV